jgi:Tol biopolymer transport system component
VQRLTDSAGDDLLPAWSPDGRRIAFVSLRDGNPEIYVMSAAGTQPTRLTFAPGGDWRPAWLPDSRHLVFSSDRGGNNDIFLLEVPQRLASDNTREPPVTAVVAGSADERDPAVNGDGELLYLSDADGVMQPYSADLTVFLASSSRTPVTGSPLLQDVVGPIGHPGWLPDGDLLFANSGSIYRAPRYANPDAWREVTAPESGALHPAGGPPWYWPQPTLGPVRLIP